MAITTVLPLASYPVATQSFVVARNSTTVTASIHLARQPSSNGMVTAVFSDGPTSTGPWTVKAITLATAKIGSDSLWVVEDINEWARLEYTISGAALTMSGSVDN
jgi:hypothetical protein